MRLSPYAKPKILAFTGLEQLISVEMGYDEIINNDSLKTKSKMDQIYRISNYVCNDAFYNAQIVQVHYTKKDGRSEEHTSELQSRPHLVCRLLLEKKK